MRNPRFLGILLLTVVCVVTAGQAQSSTGRAGQGSTGAVIGSAAGETVENAQAQSTAPDAPPVSSQTAATSVGPENAMSPSQGNNMTQRQTAEPAQQRHPVGNSTNAGSGIAGNLPQTGSQLPLLSLVGVGSLVAGIAVRMMQ